MSILQQATVELTKQDVADTVKRLYNKAEANKNGKNMTFLRTASSGYTYALTSRVNSNTLTCGEGAGAFLVKDAFKVQLEMDSCQRHIPIEYML